MERRDDSGKWLLVAHAVCCGGPLLLILIISNAAFLLNLARSGIIWAGPALLAGGLIVYLIRQRRVCNRRSTRVRSDSSLTPTTQVPRHSFPLETRFQETSEGKHPHRVLQTES